MKFFSHKKIKRFCLDGQIRDDQYIPRLKDEYVRVLSDVMREEGYVRRVDIDPDWTIEYVGNHYEFIISVYGSYIGKKNAKCIEALDKNRAIYTQKNKLEESSVDQESRLKMK